MKRLLFLLTGLTMGFLVGAWSPLGQIAETKALGLLAKSETLAELLNIKTETSPRIEALSAFQMRIQNLTNATVAAGSDNPDWAGLASLFSNRLNLEARSQKRTRLNTLTDEQASALEAAIATLEDQNRSIAAGLVHVDTSHPDYHFYTAVYHSNNQWIDYFRFNLSTGDRVPTEADLTALDLALQAGRQKVEEATFQGRIAVTTLETSLASITPANDSEQAQLALFQDWLTNYTRSFELEDQIAEHVTDYVSILQDALKGTNVSAEATAWDETKNTLMSNRIALMDERDTIKAKLTPAAS